MTSLLFIFFVLVSPLAVFASIVCTPQPDGSWICSGDGGASGGCSVVTNIVGVCTNCVALTPSECESLKSSLLDVSYEIDQTIEECELMTSTAKDVATSAIDKLNNDDYFQDQLWSDYNWILSEFESINSIADDIYSSVGSFRIRSERLNELSSSIDCSACTASFGGGSGDGSGSGESPCLSCPCKEQMVALHYLLKDEFLPRVKSIHTNVANLTNIITIANKQLEVSRQGFHNVTNLLSRLDDYVLDDFSQRVYQIRFDVNYIASNLRQRVSFIDQQYSNSTFYVSYDGEKEFDIQTLDSQLLTDTDEGPTFDWGEYKNLTWFGRVEYLLLRMNGLYSLNDNQTSSEDPASRSDEIEESASSFNQSLDEAKSSFDSVKSSAANFFNAVDNAFGGSSMSHHPEIVLISNYLNTGEPLTLNISQDVVDACRVVTSLLWTAGASVLLFRIVIVFWMYTVDVIWLLLKHITDTVK